MPANCTNNVGVVGRLAPTPSADLHIGNIFACLVAWLSAKSQGGRIVLRIEDLDPDRSKRAYIDSILRDLETLGLYWDNADIMYQSQRTAAYDLALQELEEKGIVYPCFCTRADLHAASAPHRGERYLYAGTCRGLTEAERIARSANRKPAYRLLVPNLDLCIQDGFQGAFRQNLADDCGDFIIRRSDGVYAYQLAVVVDDIEQGVNQVVRGVDLLDSAPQQQYLRTMLKPNARPIAYAHIPLMLDRHGRRLSKRDRDMGLPAILEHFRSVEHLIGYLAFLTGLRPNAEPLRADELATCCALDALEGKQHITWRLPDEGDANRETPL